MAEGKLIAESLAEKLCQDVRELSLGTSGEIERIEGPPNPLRFLRDFVLPSKPCIITHAIDHWPALAAWTNSYLVSALKQQQVSVHMTPDGHADALVHAGLISSVYGCTIGSASCVHETDPLQCLPSSSCRDNLHLTSKQETVANGTKSRQEDESEIECSICDGYACLVCSSCHSEYSFGVSASHSCPSSSPVNKCEDFAVEDEVSQQAGPATRYGKCSRTRTHVELDCDTSFVTAHVERLPFPEALTLILNSGNGNVVAYAQEQNSCFLSEYSALAADAEEHLPWATEAFGCMPEAVNLWIGNEKSVTSFHKDHYENLYAVISGEKHFTLLPPTDVHRLYIKKYPLGQYVKRDGKFSMTKKTPVELVPWVSVDPYPSSKAASDAYVRFPQYFNGPKPFTCTLQAGEILYLPSMWFHHVRQSPDPEGRTIALNFWYDMQFDIKYAYFNFLESMVSRI